jgi:two-component system phosphate regulon sensor histidine kinase PhoR
MLFRRLFLTFLLLVVAVTAAVAFVAADQLRADELTTARESLRREARLFEALPALDITSKFLDDHEIMVIASDGRVLQWSSGDPSRLGDALKWADVAEAAASGEGSAVLHDTLYVTRRLREKGFIRIGLPLRTLGDHRGVLYAGLAITAVVALLAAGVITYALVRSITQPLGDLTSLADALASGDLSRRSPIHPPGELGVLTRALNQMADALAAMVSRASKDRESLRAMLSGMAVGVIATDRSQHVLLVNRTAASLFDLADVSGRPLLEVLREERILKAAAQVLATGETVDVQLGPLRGRTIHVSVCPWPEGIVLVAHDITEAVRYQELRTEFVANVSHELRTPLTMIQGFVETLHDGALSDPVKGPEYLAILEKHVGQLSNLVRDLLDLSRIESRPGLPRTVPVDVRDVARRVADLAGPAARKKSQSISLELPSTLPAVPGDPDYLERALFNLVDNAIKYSPDGGRIRVTAAAEDESVVVEIIDNGIGIPPEDQPRVFERFYRVDKSRSRDMGGTGLGLSIVKHVVQAHGGSVDLVSSPGRGSTFRITLPAA